MTSLGRRLIAFQMIAAIAGILMRKDALAIIGVGSLCLIFVHWCVFCVRLSLLKPTLKCTRTFQGRRPNRTVTLWVDQTVDLVVEVSTTAGRLPSGTIVRDWLPDAIELVGGKAEQIVLTASVSTQLNYQLKVLAADETCFPGAALRFTDPMGLFFADHFIESKTPIRCLPGYQVREGLKPTIKRLNSLPQHGVHRLKRAGLGSELLELREYQSGDPPKSIAWKVSARREQLMTRQYESEVPVRVTVFVDASGNARQGRLSRRPIDNLNRVAANILSAAIQSGDQVGLLTIDESRQQWNRPAYGSRALQGCLRQLANFTALSNPPALSQLPKEYQQQALTRLHRICLARYPEAMQNDVNQLPFSLFPLTPWARTRWRERTQLANAISGLLNLDAVTCGQMYLNDQLILKHGMRLASENGRTVSAFGQLPVTSASWDWSTSLSKEITRAMTLARDNEVFVILTDAMTRKREIPGLLEATRLAVSRHHRVVFIGPEFSEEDLKIPARWLTPKGAGYHANAIEESDILSRAGQARQMIEAKQLKRMIRKSGASISFASPGKAAQIVLEEASLAGSGRTSRGTA